MDEESLEKTLGVVENPSDDGVFGGFGQRLGALTIEECGSHREKKHDNKRTGVFKNENLMRKGNRKVHLYNQLEDQYHEG